MFQSYVVGHTVILTPCPMNEKMERIPAVPSYFVKITGNPGTVWGNILRMIVFFRSHIIMRTV
jgi:hypothetical protein